MYCIVTATTLCSAALLSAGRRKFDCGFDLEFKYFHKGIAIYRYTITYPREVSCFPSESHFTLRTDDPRDGRTRPRREEVPGTEVRRLTEDKMLRWACIGIGIEVETRRSDDLYAGASPDVYGIAPTSRGVSLSVAAFER